MATASKRKASPALVAKAKEAWQHYKSACQHGTSEQRKHACHVAAELEREIAKKET